MSQVSLPTDQILKALKKTMGKYVSSIGSYSETQWNDKPSADEWSMGQLYEHIAMSTSGYFCYKINTCLRRENGSESLNIMPGGLKMYQHNSFPPFKFKVPQGLGDEPSPLPQSTYTKRFANLMEQLEDLAEAVKKDNGKFRSPHAVPEIGALNANEWLQMTEMHMRHHLKQKAYLDEYLMSKQN